MMKHGRATSARVSQHYPVTESLAVDLDVSSNPQLTEITHPENGSKPLFPEGEVAGLIILIPLPFAKYKFMPCWFPEYKTFVLKHVDLRWCHIHTKNIQENEFFVVFLLSSLSIEGPPPRKRIVWREAQRTPPRGQPAMPFPHRTSKIYLWHTTASRWKENVRLFQSIAMRNVEDAQNSLINSSFGCIIFIFGEGHGGGGPTSVTLRWGFVTMGDPSQAQTALSAWKPSSMRERDLTTSGQHNKRISRWKKQMLREIVDWIWTFVQS